MSFSKNLKSIIDARGLKLRRISGATGIPVSTLSEWTAGREPKLTKSTVNLANFLGVTLEYLVTGKDSSQLNSCEVVCCLLQIEGTDYRLRLEKISDKES